MKKIPGGIEPNCKLGRSSPAQADEEVSRVLNWCKGILLQIIKKNIRGGDIVGFRPKIGMEGI